MKRSLFLLSSIIVIACTHHPKLENQSSSSKTKAKDTLTGLVEDRLHPQVFGEGSFGYDVYDGKKLVIHQPVIPGVAGNAGFETKEEVLRAAQLVISKLRKGQMPPTISPGELKQLKVHF